VLDDFWCHPNRSSIKAPGHMHALGLSKLNTANNIRLETLVFGSQAVVAMQGMAEDPWLCVPGFHRVCLYRSNGLKGTDFQKATSLSSFQARRHANIIILRRPGDHGHFCDCRPVGFASPDFTGFAFFRLHYFLFQVQYT
jgi:hypothetical protein